MPAPMSSRNQHRQLTFEDLRGLRAEGYIRDSTLDQQHGFGPDIQRHNEERFAQSYGLILGTRWYTEFVSGRSASKRKEFQQALEDARLDLYDVLLVDHTSRYGRNQAECIRYKEELQKLGKIVVFVSQGIISGSDRDFLSERMNETLDEQYSRNLSRYVREGKARQAEAGVALGNAPLGYRHLKNPDGRGVLAVPDPNGMAALMALLRGYASGKHSFRSLADELNAKGYRTTEGKPFTVSSISTVLNNPFYSGKFYYHRGRPDQEMREGVHEVPGEVKDAWVSCQEVRRLKARPGNPSPRSRQQRVYPLTGVLVCDGCGQPFHGRLNRSRSGSYRRMFHGWHRCGLKPLSVPAARVEEELAHRVLRYITLDDGWRESVLRALAQEGPTPDNNLEGKRIEGAIANLKKQHLWGAVADEEFKGEFQRLSRQLKALEPRPVQALTPNLDRAAKLLGDLPALWEHPGVNDEQRRELARVVFDEVRLREGRLVAVKPRHQYAPLFAYSLCQFNAVGGDRSS